MNEVTFIANIFNPGTIPIILGCNCSVSGPDIGPIVAKILHYVVVDPPEK